MNTGNIQTQFANRVVDVVKADNTVIGLAAAGSWITNEMDEFSDLDLVLVTTGKVGGDKDKMLAYANRFGKLLTGFTGEHVGEPRVLICLYDEPLLHVDIKFVTAQEFEHRVEQPVILHDTNNQLQTILQQTQGVFPYPDQQWIEDRFWVWIHYVLLKIARGEYFEVMDSLAFIRSRVLGPLMHIHNNKLPRGVRKIETQTATQDVEMLKATIPQYNKASLLDSLQASVLLYRKLRAAVFSEGILLRSGTEKRVMKYFEEVKKAVN